MSRIHFLSLFIAIIALGGCQEPEAQTSRAPIEGIKITDLAPQSNTKIPPQTVFRVLTFEVHADKMDALGETFKSMSKRQLHFADRDAFDANGFLAGFGSQGDWGGFSATLEKVISQSKGARNVVVYESIGDDITVSMLNSTEEVAWAGPGGRTVRDIFAVGRFTWMIKARRMESIRGLAQVQIMPAYRLGTQNLFAHLAHFQDVTPFSGCAINVRMSPGDYILLGSAGEPIARDGLPIGPLTLNRLLFYPVERPGTLRLFLILCVGVED